MSADNWTTCHVCVEKAVEKHRKEVEAVKQSYGNVSAEEYLKNREKLQAPVPADFQTLREDYEIGLTEGAFSVCYGGRCTECGFRFEFTKKISAEEVLKSQGVPDGSRQRTQRTV